MIQWCRTLTVRITAGDSEYLLRKLAEENIVLMDVRRADLLNISISFYYRHYPKVAAVLQKIGAEYSVIRSKGIFATVEILLRHGVLLAGIFLFLIAAIFLPTRIFFLKVEGNVRIPTQLIREQVQSCGVVFGSSRKAVRSETIKNALLERNPELQWVGLNTRGCVVTVQVKERAVEQLKTGSKVSSIMARVDGVISRMTVYAGTALCKVGDHVNIGDILISGYTDCETKVQASTANGEVFGYTLRENAVISPKTGIQKGETVNIQICYKLKIGKKLINLCNHSGISGVTCDKMYAEEYWTLPGNYILPISLIRIKQIFWNKEDASVLDVGGKVWMKEYSDEYLQSQMIAGKIIHAKYHFSNTDDFSRLTSVYTCEEMIGKVKYEETLERNAENY